MLQFRPGDKPLDRAALVRAAARVLIQLDRHAEQAQPRAADGQEGHSEMEVTAS